MLEAEGNIWELNAPYGGHMGATCAIWELCVCQMGVVCTLYRSCMGAMCPCGSHMVPNRRWMVPYGSCM
jgi:hypothetical protein